MKTIEKLNIADIALLNDLVFEASKHGNKKEYYKLSIKLMQIAQKLTS